MEKKLISTCKKDRSSSCPDGSPRKTTKDMGMYVIHEIVKGKKTSKTVYQ